MRFVCTAFQRLNAESRRGKESQTRSLSVLTTMIALFVSQSPQNGFGALRTANRLVGQGSHFGLLWQSFSLNNRAGVLALVYTLH